MSSAAKHESRYLALAWLATRKRAFSAAELAEAVGVTARTARRTLSQLEDRGFVECFARASWRSRIVWRD